MRREWDRFDAVLQGQQASQEREKQQQEERRKRQQSSTASPKFLETPGQRELKKRGIPSFLQKVADKKLLAMDIIKDYGLFGVFKGFEKRIPAQVVMDENSASLRFNFRETMISWGDEGGPSSRGSFDYITVFYDDENQSLLVNGWEVKDDMWPEAVGLAVWAYSTKAEGPPYFKNHWPFRWEKDKREPERWLEWIDESLREKIQK